MPSTTETSADDDDEEDAGLWLFSQAGAEEAEGCYMRVLALQESIRSESWLPPFANYELGVLLLRSRSTASEGLKKLHEVAAFTPDYDFKLKLVLKCHLTLIDYEDRTMGSAEA